MKQQNRMLRVCVYVRVVGVERCSWVLSQP